MPSAATRQHRWERFVEHTFGLTSEADKTASEIYQGLTRNGIDNFQKFINLDDTKLASFTDPDRREGAVLGATVAMNLQLRHDIRACVMFMLEAEIRNMHALPVPEDMVTNRDLETFISDEYRMESTFPDMTTLLVPPVA